MAKKKKSDKQIEQYEHKDKDRANIPPVGLVTPASDPDTGKKKTYEYDPHLDPQLQWAGKAEHTSFEVPTVSLHVHERIDPKSIIDTVKKEKKGPVQMSLFDTKREKPLREAIDFYKHKEGWSNRLIAGDSLLVMNSLLEKEGMAGKVQMVYFDPPYGIKYGSNFQPFVNKRNVKDGEDADLTAEPEMIKAFRDTWELGIHSYLTYLRDRLLLAREMLHESGSIFVQISDDNLHHVREIMDEVFGPQNFIALISFKTATNQNANRIQKLYDYLVWYGKSKNIKFNRLFRDRTETEINGTFNLIDDNDNRYKAAQIDGFNEKEIKNLKKIGRLTANNKYGMRMPIDFEKTEIDNVWYGTIISTFSKEKKYVVQTSTETVKRAMIMTTNPGDLVLDITCGSGTTTYVAEEFGRRWITCDTSRVSLTLAKQRIMTALFNYYELAFPNEGIGSGLKYNQIPHTTLKKIARNEPPINENLFDEPIINNNKQRIAGPFTVEAVPAPYAKSFDELEQEDCGSDTSIARTGETHRQSEWRDELMRTGVRAKGGKTIEFSRVEPLSGTKFIQAEAETKEDIPKKVLVVFGPEHAPLEQRQVEDAWQEARALRPDMLLFCAFQFDDEAAKDIDELTPKIAGMQLLKAQMNADMLTDDLRKKRSSNESFWLVGQPDVKVHKRKDGKIQVEVMGFDYYNPKNGNVESGGKNNIAMWMLDTDYNNRSLFPSQVFFPMAGNKEGWSKLAKNLKAEIDEEKIEAFRGTASLVFEPGTTIAIKIIDDRGIESLRVINM